MSTLPDQYRYPALLGFDVPTGRYYVLFPDLPGCTTTGDSEEEALECAQEALSLHLYGMEKDHDEIPSPSHLVGLHGENGEVVVPVEVWMPAYREHMEMKAVNRTVTLPNWLDKAGKKAKLNYSRILQDGIMQRLKLGRALPRAAAS